MWTNHNQLNESTIFTSGDKAILVSQKLMHDMLPLFKCDSSILSHLLVIQHQSVLACSTSA